MDTASTKRDRDADASDNAVTNELKRLRESYAQVMPDTEYRALLQAEIALLDAKLDAADAENASELHKCNSCVEWRDSWRKCVLSLKPGDVFCWCGPVEDCYGEHFGVQHGRAQTRSCPKLTNLLSTTTTCTFMSAARTRLTVNTM
jgi:hypothetical protein